MLKNVDFQVRILILPVLCRLYVLQLFINLFTGDGDGNEFGEQNDGVIGLQATAAAQVVQHQRHGDTHNQLHHQEVQGVEHGVADGPPGILGFEEELKVLESNPWTS